MRVAAVAAAGVRSCTGVVLELEVEQSEALGMLYWFLRTCWTHQGDQMVTGAASTANHSADAAAPGSEEPQPGAYLKAGDGIFIKLPWASSSRAPVEGEILDREVLTAAGLTLVDAPSSNSDEPEEERLLRKLLSLYRAR